MRSCQKLFCHIEYCACPTCVLQLSNCPSRIWIHMWHWIFGTKDQKSSFSTLWSMTGEKVKTPQHFYFLSVVSSVLTSGDKLSGQLALLMTVGKHDKRAEDGLLDFQRCVACCGGELFNLTAAVFDFEEKKVLLIVLLIVLLHSLTLLQLCFVA